MQSFALVWQAWSLAAIVAVTVVVAIVVRVSRPAMLPNLPLPHVAAAALIGVLAWEGLLTLPNIVTTFGLTYAGIDHAPELPAYQAFLVASTAYVAAGGLAVIGLVRRQPWAVALGIGLCVARLGLAGIGVTQMLSLASEGGPPDVAWFAVTIGLHAVPAVAAIVLLAWPATRGGLRRSPEIATANAERERRDGIVDAGSAGADEVEWPDWSSPARDRG